MSLIITCYEVSHETGLSIDMLVEIVEHGIVEPEGDNPEQWLFPASCLCTLQRVSRLQRDLDLDWQAIALILELTDQRDQLREENAALLRRLERFDEL